MITEKTQVVHPATPGIQPRPTSLSTPTTGQIKARAGVNTEGAREIRRQVGDMAADYVRDQIGSVLTPQPEFKGHAATTPVWGAREEQKTEEPEETGMPVDDRHKGGIKRPRSESISKPAEAMKRQRPGTERLATGETLVVDPATPQPRPAHPFTGVTSPTEMCRMLIGWLENFGGNLSDSNLRGRVADMLRQLGLQTRNQSLVDFGNEVSSGDVSSELLSRIQDKVKEICNPYLTKKQYADPLRDKATRGVDEFGTPISKTPWAPRAKPRTVSPLVRPGLRTPAPGLTLRPEAPTTGPVPFKLPDFLVTPHKPPKFRTTEHERQWANYKKRISEVGKYNKKDLIDNPKTYAEYKTNLDKANVLARRWKFEPVIPQFIKKEDKQNVQDKLQEMLEIIVQEQRTVEQKISDTQKEQKKLQKDLDRKQARGTRLGKTIRDLQDQVRTAPRHQTPKLQKDLVSRQKENQNQTRRIYEAENKATAMRRELEELVRNNQELQDRKPGVIEALKELQTAQSGIDLSRAHSALQRQHTVPGSAPRHLQTPEPTHTTDELRKAAMKGPAHTQKKVETLSKQLLESRRKLKGHRQNLVKHETIESPREGTKETIEDLLERYTNRRILDSSGYYGLVQNIHNLIPGYQLRNVREKQLKLNEDDRATLAAILQDMKSRGLKKSQLISILEVLQVPVATKLRKTYQTLVSVHDGALSKFRDIDDKVKKAQSLHRHAEGFQVGKGKLLKLLKPSRKKPKKRAKKKAPKKELQQVRERIGPFRL